MRRFHCLATILLLLSAAENCAVASEAGRGYGLQMPGSFHGEEVVAWDGEPWLALVIDAHGAHLEEVMLLVRPVHDPVIDAEGEATGLEVVAQDVEAAAFLRGPGLRAGALDPSIASELRLTPGLRVWLDPEHTRAIGLACSTFDTPPADGECTVAVSGDIGTSKLAVLPATLTADGMLLLGDDGHARVLFAGDLNGDLGTDYLLDVSEHYNRSRVLLFMSQPQGHHAWPVQVAEYTSTGC